MERAKPTMEQFGSEKSSELFVRGQLWCCPAPGWDDGGWSLLAAGTG